jgi:hypothetical protein
MIQLAKQAQIWHMLALKVSAFFNLAQLPTLIVPQPLTFVTYKTDNVPYARKLQTVQISIQIGLATPILEFA